MLVEWIRQGAIDPREGGETTATATNEWDTEFRKRLEWWSLQPPMVVEPPQVADAEYARSEVDRFIRAGLERAGLTPAPRAEFDVLLRRLAFVLTGLPPTPEFRARHLAAAVADAEGAYRAAVDELLASPRYGERFARHWMDVVRYTDTYGYEWDNPPRGVRVPDYLVRAYNADVGFDTLLREQIAGDLLPTPRVNAELGVVENLIGPMFHHLGSTATAAVWRSMVFIRRWSTTRSTPSRRRFWQRPSRALGVTTTNSRRCRRRTTTRSGRCS